jgi:hypothetical protein
VFSPDLSPTCPTGVQDWGFKLMAVAKLKPSESDGDAGEVEDLNPNPIYVGQTPSYVSPLMGAEGLLARLVRPRRRGG